MAARTAPKVFTPGTTTLFVICLLAIMLLLLFFIIPNQRASARLDMEIIQTRNNLEGQKILSPLFKDLTRQAQTEPLELPFPERQALPRDNIAALGATFQDLAGQSMLVFGGMTPHVNTMRPEDGLMMVDVAVQGDFPDLRGFLVGLGALPYLDKVEQLHINGVQAVKQMDLKLWLAVK